MPRKLRVWHARQEACSCVTRRQEVWPQRLCGRPKTYINQGRLRPSQYRVEKYHHRPYAWLSLTLPMCTFRVIKKKTRKDADYIFIHQPCSCSSLYTTHWMQLPNLSAEKDNPRRIDILLKSINQLINFLSQFGLVWFHGISTIVGYLMPNSLYTYILDIYDLVWLSLKAYQPLWVI